MPELPDLTVYLEALKARIANQPLEDVRLASPFLLRSVTPPIAEAIGRRVIGLERLGKRLVFAFEREVFLVLHLMIAGRLKWGARGARPPGRIGLAAFDFPNGTLLLTEAATKKRASLRVVGSRDELALLDPGGLEPLKRALTDPHIFAGIGNAYSDEILHRAQLSPVRMSTQLDADELARLHEAVHAVLLEWTERLRKESGDAFPEKVTAFREGMAVHGRYKKPCPRCGGPVQRIRYAENETNYCPACQTGGKLLADRSLSRLLHGDWPRTLEELEERKSKRRAT
jgi:formamidopyrimidine-DNA glycosylase